MLASKRTYLRSLVVVLVASCLSVHAASEHSKRPNILVIVADDLGFADVGAHGGKDIPTPHIDSIARQGIRFSNGYVSGPYCSPTRAGLLTGRYQERFGHEFNPPGPTPANPAGLGLPLTETTIANRLHDARYKTGIIGKWHLGFTEAYNPINRGFDEFFGFQGPLHSYTNLATAGPNPIRRGLTPVVETNYLTDAFTREAVSFITRHRQEPFYLQLAYNAVHSPLDAHPKYYDRFPNISDEKRRRYAAVYAAMDDGVGEVLKALQDTGLDENTLIFFFSDNGGPTSDNTSRNEPLRGYKAQTWEGGIHIPFFARWKGKLPAGRVYTQLLSNSTSTPPLSLQPG
jgi:arylsulfatase A-like enzyme